MADEIRTASREDIPALTEIYNYYVHNTPITFDMAAKTIAERTQWFDQFGEMGRHQLLVALEAGVVVGYVCSHQFRTKDAYETSIETTIYLSPQATGGGLGGRLYEALFTRLREEDVHKAFAGITLPNEASIKLHERQEFTYLGTFTEVGRKFDRYWDVAWYQKDLSQ